MSDTFRTPTQIAAEAAAADHLRRLGYEIVGEVVLTRYGCIDIIALGHDTLVFVELSASDEGDAQTATTTVEFDRARALRRRAAAWLHEAAAGRYLSDEIRFDAIAITFDKQGRVKSLDHTERAL